MGQIRGWGARYGSLAVGCLLLGASFLAQSQSVKPASGRYEKEVLPSIKKYCIQCHTGANAPAGIDLASIKTQSQMVKQGEVWERVWRAIDSGAMPPKGMYTPPEKDRKQLVTSIQSILSSNCDLTQVGRVTLRRLNRLEYDNTIRDLTGLNLGLARDFPSDDVGYGFDNIGDVLSMSPLLLEKYLVAAETIAKKAIQTPLRFKKPLFVDDLTGTEGTAADSTSYVIYAPGSVSAPVTIPKRAQYRIKIIAFGAQAGDEPAKMALSVNGRKVTDFVVRAERATPGTYEFTTWLNEGRQQLMVTFTNDYYKPDHPDPKQRDRNLYVEMLEVSGPVGEQDEYAPSHTRLLPVPLVEGNYRSAIKSLAERVYRRSLEGDELDRLVQFGQSAVKRGDSLERSAQLVFQALLSSPNFLFRVENAPKEKIGPLGDFELANRLSYFLWSSMPDAHLFDLARKGELKKPEVLRLEVKRMIDDAKAASFIESFVGQWLQVRKLDVVTPDPGLFASYDSELADAMRAETNEFFRHILIQNLQIADFLDSNYTFLNERLAAHYGIAGVTGNAIRKVELKGSDRGGIMTQAAILTLTSNPNRTSPVKRGKFVLENLLGAPPPPPPPGVGNLKDDAASTKGKTLREQMEIHRKNPECSTCHARMDGFGMALEVYDGIGKRRSNDNGLKIDSRASLPSGVAFEGPSGLKKYLMTQRSSFTRCLVEKLLVYAIGRGPRASDRCFVDDIVKKSGEKGDRLRSLIELIVLSEPFQKVNQP